MNVATQDTAARRATRKAQNRAMKRNQILKVAGEMFVRQGFASTSIDEIAAQLEVGKPFIYYYFKDKLTIFETLCVESSDFTHKAFEVNLGTRRSATEKLTNGLRELILRYLCTFAGGALYYKEPGLLTGTAKETVRNNALVLHADLMMVLEEGKKSGQFAYEDAKLTALMIGGSIGFLFNWYRTDSRLSPEELADFMAENLVKIALAPAAR